jgi:hypothetical protein
MIRKVESIPSPFSPKKMELENSITDFARDIDMSCAPNYLVEVANGIPLADNYSSPLRVGLFGKNYDLLDIEAKYEGLSETDAYLAGARLTFKRYAQAGSTIVELMSHHPSTPLAEVPFCITPFGCEKPLTIATFEDVIYLLNDLVQWKQGDITALFDPREEEVMSLAESFNVVSSMVSEGAEKRTSQRIHELNTPIVTSIHGEPHFIERSIGVNLQRTNGRLDYITLYIDGSHDINGNIVNQRLAFSHRLKTGLSEVLSYTGTTDLATSKLETEIAHLESGDDIIGLFQEAISTLTLEKQEA